MAVALVERPKRSTPAQKERAVLEENFHLLPFPFNASFHQLTEVLCDDRINFSGNELGREIGVRILTSFLAGAQDMLNDIGNKNFSLPEIFLISPKDSLQQKNTKWDTSFFIPEAGIFIDKRWLEYYAREVDSVEKLHELHYLKLTYNIDGRKVVLRIDWTPLEESHEAGREEVHHPAYYDIYNSLSSHTPEVFLNGNSVSTDVYDAQPAELLALHALLAGARRKARQNKAWIGVEQFYARRIHKALLYLKRSGGDYNSLLLLVPQTSGILLYTPEDVAAEDF